MATAAVEDLLRLAWHADGEGRPGMRDALLTLAVAESGPDDAVLAERCRKLLVARRPDHWFANSTTLGQALGRAKVVEALARLRATFPPVRVARLLLRSAVLRGPYMGQSLPFAHVLSELSLTPDGPHLSRARAHSGSRSNGSTHALPFPGSTPKSNAEAPGRGDSVDADGALVALYWSVLLAMAVLLCTVLEPAARDTKAA